MAIDKELTLRMPLRNDENEPTGDNLLLLVDREYQATLAASGVKLVVSSEDLQEAVGALWMFFGRLR
jgi:hypothetical protein